MEQQQEDSKYYIPIVEEVCQMGYQYEYININGDEDVWEAAVWPKVYLDKSSGWVEYNEQAIQNMINIKEIRTKYLDKTDIEKCGWEHVGTMRDGGTATFSYNDKYVLDYRGSNMYYKDTDKYREITIKELKENHLFNHICTLQCKSMNELVKLMQWIGIKQGN